MNVDGYTASNLIAAGPGVYGVYAFNSKGGTMKNSVAYDNNDSGFYIGQTPKQAKPKRSMVTDVQAYRNVLGFSGTNMRYVTIKNSKWFNNGSGIVPSSLKSEKFPPPQDNVISGNEVFWNNYNYYAGAKFRIPKTGPAGLAGYPLGVGILLFGGQGHTVEKNKVYGNWLVGYGAIEQLTLTAAKKSPALKEAAILRRNTVRNNDFGLGGTRPERPRHVLRRLRDAELLLGQHAAAAPTCRWTTARSHRAPLRRPTPATRRRRTGHRLDRRRQREGPEHVREVTGSGTRTRPRRASRRWCGCEVGGHDRRIERAGRGFPSVPCTYPGGSTIKNKAKTFTALTLGASLLALGPAAEAAKAPKKTVSIGDNFFSPKKTSVKAGTTVKWKWPSDNADSTT